MTERHADSKRRLLEYLKRKGTSNAVELSEFLGVSEVAVRQHLQALRDRGLVVSRTGAPVGRGRPAILWSLTEESRNLFPDRHGELALDLIGAVRKAFGEEGVEEMLRVRGRQQVRTYQTAIPDAGGSLIDRVRALAKVRSSEGYMAEARQEDDGSIILVEHHCPICVAARDCAGLCSTELDVFRRVLGRRVRIERTAHLLSGSDRCIYRITKKAD